MKSRVQPRLHHIEGFKMTWDTATGTLRRGRSTGSFRKDKEDLALFEDLSTREDLDSPLGMFCYLSIYL